MLNRTLSKLLSLAALSLATLPALAAEKALVIIDMQHYFASRGAALTYFDNPSKVEVLLQKQKEMIQLAKGKNLPIVVVEYNSEVFRGNLRANRLALLEFNGLMGITDQTLLSAIGEYQPATRVLKVTDGLFDSRNFSGYVARKQLAEWGVRELVVMGANGNACVKRTIEGALLSGFKVLAYTEGIADFNYESFIYPFVRQYPVIMENEVRNFTDPSEIGLK